MQQNWALFPIVPKYPSSYLAIITNSATTTQIWVNIGSGDGLVPDGIKPLAEQC